MAGTGPAPKHPDQRRRRNARPVMRRLPSEGRKGRAPSWPLPPDVKVAAAIKSFKRQREMLEAQIDGGTATRGAPARLAKLDQLIAELEAQLKESSALEKKLWAELWKTPQAVAWEELGYNREVAQYARWKALAELGDLDAAKEARHLSDRLGLTPLAMLRLQWEIARDEVGEKRESTPSASGSRRRLRAVDTG